MRTLIIDNYDSFTYNLFHLVAAVNGESPIVILNDDVNWDIGQLACFDNVVISPGPGHPMQDGDFGICREVIARAKIPVLGVCLGHQGICLHEGARVDLAPEPRHGRLSQISHSGVDILQDIPSPFTVVRYHSLIVTELPDSLEAIGRAEDDLLMAVRHRERPLWGVQFHPESISSTFGAQIIRNFAALTRQWQNDGRCMPKVAELPEYLLDHQRYICRKPGNSNQDFPKPRTMSVLTKKILLPLSAEYVFEKLYGSSPYAFWLDSSLTNVPYGRFSFMGDASGPLARVATANVSKNSLTIWSNGKEEVVQSSFFDWINTDLASFDILLPDLPFEFALGWVGYLGYELKAECYASAAHRSEYPDANMIFADRAIAFDHVEGSVYLLTLVSANDQSNAGQLWIEATSDRLTLLANQPVRKSHEMPGEILDDGLSLRHDRNAYLELVARSKDAILAGETYEVCLTNMITASGKIDPWSTYCALRRNNPAPFAAYLQLDELWVLSGSPERFLSISGDGLVESKPIKGTRPRGKSAIEDERLRENLHNSEKDRAENLMIVDLIRNDLGTCAEIESVSVPKLFDIESYATVHQMVSTVRATLRQGVSAVNCVRAAFPGGSMTGAPKIRTMQILDEFEGGARGIYSGSLGYFSLSGAVDFNIVIRTMIVSPDKVSFGVGGAITALSDAADEFEETAVKATSLLQLFNAHFPGREAASAESAGSEAFS